MESTVLSIRDILKILQKRIVLIIVMMLITTIGAITLTYLVIKPTYATTAKLFFGMPTMHEDGNGNASWDFAYYQKLIQPYSEIIKSDDLMERAIERGNLNMSPSALSSSLIVQSSEQTMTLSIYTQNPGQGVEILNAVIDEFIATSNKLIQNSNISVISSPKIAGAPVSPNKPKNIVFGIGLGLALGVALVLIIEYMDNSVKDEEEAENLMGIPMLGVIPEYDKNIKSNKKEKKNEH